MATASQRFLPFKDAFLYARSLGLNNTDQWDQWSKSSARPANIPSSPHNVYKHGGWQGYRHWLGTGTKKFLKKFLPFEEALAAARQLCPPRFPSVSPHFIYTR